jgi:hypothetical protein
MEPRIHAEVGHRVAQMGLTRKEANRVVLKLVEGYEKKIPEAPIGKIFNECYQMDKIRPTDEYETLYDKKKQEWNKNRITNRSFSIAIFFVWIGPSSKEKFYTMSICPKRNTGTRYARHLFIG